MGFQILILFGTNVNLIDTSLHNGNKKVDHVFSSDPLPEWPGPVFHQPSVRPQPAGRYERCRGGLQPCPPGSQGDRWATGV